MAKKSLLIVAVFSILISLLSGKGLPNKFAMNPVMKSAILPGWGELTLGQNRKARIFYISEGILWLAFFTNTAASNILRKNYIAYAGEHASVITAGKDKKFWVDLGNYYSIDDYNAEHLRNREVSDLYPGQSTWDWRWDSEKNRSTFEQMRINSDLWKQGAVFIAGGIVLNHFLSMIDVLYLKRIQTIRDVSIIPVFDKDSSSLIYRLSIYF